MTMLDARGHSADDCRDVVTLSEGGFEQAHLLIENVMERPNGGGDSPARFLKACGDRRLLQEPVSELDEIDIDGTAVTSRAAPHASC